METDCKIVLESNGRSLGRRESRRTEEQYLKSNVEDGNWDRIRIDDFTVTCR